MATFGSRLRELRENKGLRQEDIGDLFDFGKSTVSQWESGKSQPEYNILVKLAEFFDVSVDHLLGRPLVMVNEPAPPNGEINAGGRGKILSYINTNDDQTPEKAPQPSYESVLLAQEIDELPPKKRDAMRAMLEALKAKDEEAAAGEK